MTPTEARQKLNPPAYQPDAKDDSLALIRYAYEEYIWSLMDDLKTYVEQNEKQGSVDVKVRSDGLHAVESLNTAWFREDSDDINNWWEAYVPPSDKMLMYLKNGLSDPHEGDCTAVASSCMRCIAETYYKIPYTATWSKAEGHRLLLLSKTDR
jgi:hypothetical protein